MDRLPFLLYTSPLKFEIAWGVYAKVYIWSVFFKTSGSGKLFSARVGGKFRYLTMHIIGENIVHFGCGICDGLKLGDLLTPRDLHTSHFPFPTSSLSASSIHEFFLCSSYPRCPSQALPLDFSFWFIVFRVWWFLFSRWLFVWFSCCEGCCVFYFSSSLWGILFGVKGGEHCFLPGCRANRWSVIPPTCGWLGGRGAHLCCGELCKSDLLDNETIISLQKSER